MLRDEEIVDIVDRDFPMAAGRARRACRWLSHVDEDDLRQEARAAVALAMRTYDPSRGSPRTYARHVARNAILDVLRRELGRGRMPRAEDGMPLPAAAFDLTEHDVPDEADVHDALERAAVSELGRRFIERVSSSIEPRHRRAFEVRATGATVAEVARTLGVKPGVAKQSIKRAIEKGRRLANHPEFRDLGGAS